MRGRAHLLPWRGEDGEGSGRGTSGETRTKLRLDAAQFQMGVVTVGGGGAVYTRIGTADRQIGMWVGNMRNRIKIVHWNGLRSGNRWNGTRTRSVGWNGTRIGNMWNRARIGYRGNGIGI